MRHGYKLTVPLAGAYQVPHALYLIEDRAGSHTRWCRRRYRHHGVIPPGSAAIAVSPGVLIGRARPNHRLIRGAFHRIFHRASELLLHSLLVLPLFSSGIRDDQCPLARRRGAGAVRSAIRGGLPRRAQVGENGRVAGGAIGHSQPRH
jgi:hypothetical protein